MFNRIRNVTVIGAALLLLTGCPPPSVYEIWRKAGASKDDIRSAMAACGFTPADASSTGPRNERIKKYLCMKQAGYDVNGFDICSVNQDQPACVEAKQGYPVSIEQLAALPYHEDLALWAGSSVTQVSTEMLITWLPPGATLDFKQRIANYDITLPVMYACGYPNPLGTRPQVSMADAARIQVCMQNQGFVPMRAHVASFKMIPVCTQFPELPPCAALRP